LEIFGENNEKLLEYVKKENKAKQTALHLAQEDKHTEIENILKSYIQ